MANVHREVMITTTDNPFDPFEDFNAWYKFDVENGYNSCALLARISKVSEELSITDIESDLEEAIDEIVFYNLSGVHKKVVLETEEDVVQL